MADIKLKYQSATQSLTVSGFNSLASGSYATSNAVDNESDLFVDVMVEVTVADMVESTNKQVLVYIINSVDSTNYSDNQSTNPAGMRLLGIVPMNGTGPWRSSMMSVASAFGGVVPPKWKVVLYNDNGSTALAGSGNTVQYRGIYYQSV